MPLRILTFVLLWLFTFTATATETILSFHSDITIQHDASLLVVESITVRAEGYQIKRGIYRDFPTDYKDDHGFNYQVGFKMLGALRDGSPEPFHTTRQDNGLRIYLGDQNRYLEPGIYIYTLRYQTSRQLGFFTDHDELYWNVTGNQWRFPILKASATVYLPTSAGEQNLSLNGFTGTSGQQGKEYLAHQQGPHTANFESTRTLNPGEGLTIVLGWPKNIITKPDSSIRFRYFLEDNPEIPVATIGIALTFLYYLFAWIKVGKDPEAGIIIPRYSAPKGFSPASIRFIKRMHYDHKTFAAAVINLAVKGHINIEEGASGKFVLNKKNSNTELLPGEKTLLNQLFPGESQFIELKQSNHLQIKKALKAHQKSLQLNYEKIYFLSNSSYLAPGIILTLGTLAIMLITLPAGNQTATTLFFVLWLSIWSFGVFALLLSAYRNWRRFFIHRSAILLIPAISNSIFALPFLAGELFSLGLLFTQGSAGFAISLPILILINFSFYNWLKAPTLAGRKLLDQIDGFRLYLSVAEKDELNFLHPPHKTVEVFEQFLPYALALDVEQQWSEQFSTLLHQASLGEAYQPRWYNSGHWHSSHFSTFGSAVGNSITSAIASSSTAPGSSSGSGGGGSSGGGGGGGGGGGW
jgi:uncharacterized membrane protein YgcG